MKSFYRHATKYENNCFGCSPGRNSPVSCALLKAFRQRHGGGAEITDWVQRAAVIMSKVNRDTLKTLTSITMKFFRVILYNIFMVYDKFIYGFVFKDLASKDSSKIHSILILSFIQWINLFFTILSIIYINIYKESLPTYIFIFGLIILNVINFKMYNNKEGKFDEIVKSRPSFFSNQWISRIIAFLYISLSFVLWIWAADYGKQHLSLR